MTGKLRLEDLRVFTGRFEDHPVGLGEPIYEEATIADWVEVGRQLGAEIRVTTKSPRLANPWIPVLEPGDYLVLKLPVESPTPKEGQ